MRAVTTAESLTRDIVCLPITVIMDTGSLAAKPKSHFAHARHGKLKMETIGANDIGRLVRGRMGLIIGPGLTCYPGVLDDLADEIAETFGLENPVSFFDVADAALANGVHSDELRFAVRKFLARQQPSALLTHLAGAKWAAVYSACLDSFLEDKLREAAGGKLSGEQVAVVPDLNIPPPPRMVPIYKLLGTPARDSFAYSGALYVTARAAWRHAVKGFADRVRGNPVLCVGMSDAPQVLYDLIGEICASHSTSPASLLLLDEDPVCQDTKLRSVIGSRTKLTTIRSTIGEVVAAASMGGQSGQMNSRASANGEADYASISQFSDLVCVVNSQLTTNIPLAEQLRLHDLLFSPVVPRWDPYVHDLDFRRSVGGDFTEQCIALLKNATIDECAAVLLGTVASGKTTVLKRIAFDLASNGYTTLWFRPWFYQDNTRVLYDLFSALKGQLDQPLQPIVIVIDDPCTFGSLTARQIVTAARNVGLSLFLITSVRVSDWDTLDRTDMVGGIEIRIEERLPDELNEVEWKAFPEYLIRLGVASDLVAANEMIGGVDCRQAKDTLSMLYFLLPATRAHISGAIRNEYFRLGDVAGLSSVIIGAVNHTSTLLKSAYQMVAVADHYGAALPMEVLVSALDVSFGDWLDATREKGPAWGLLYVDESAGGDTDSYRTRNSIVTDQIIYALNGGGIGHAGELRVMQSLLSACKGSSPAYREFCIRVLVPSSKLNQLDYVDGIRLYDAALDSLPRTDKALLHHKSLWIKNVGNDPIQASRVALEALAAPDAPYADRGEADEHIHTSLAAMALDSIEKQRLGIAEGKAAALRHLDLAKSVGFFNPNAVHVQAGLMLKLVDHIGDTSPTDKLELIDRAVGDVDSTLDIILSPHGRASHSEDSVVMLEKMRDKLVDKIRSNDVLRDDAEAIWRQFASQKGFVLFARQLLRKAVNENRGTAFKAAFDYFKQSLSKVKERGDTPSASLMELGATIYYKWRVRRHIHLGSSEPIDWGFLRDTSMIATRSRNVVDQPFCHYLHALALAHLGEWAAANAIFTDFRRSRMRRELVWLPRDYLLTPSGAVRKVQGELHQGAERKTIWSDELQADFYVDRVGRWGNIGEIEIVVIRFAFSGATAINDS